jgi:hypothetical protein
MGKTRGDMLRHDYELHFFISKGLQAVSIGRRGDSIIRRGEPGACPNSERRSLSLNKRRFYHYLFTIANHPIDHANFGFDMV